MRKQFVVLFFFLLAAVFTAVGFTWGYYMDGAAKTGTVGIVDLQKVADTMGWSEEMRRNAQETERKYRDEVDVYLRPSREAFEHKRDNLARGVKHDPAEITKATQTADLEKLGLTKEQIDELTRGATTFRTESNAANARLNQAMQSQQQALILACSHAAEPAIRRVAAANHRTVVLTQGGTLLYNDPATDLTDKVIDDLQHAMQMKVTLPEPPRLELHPVPPPATQPR